MADTPQIPRKRLQSPDLPGSVTELDVPFLFYSGYDDAYVCDKWPNATAVTKPASEQVLITALFGLIRR